MLQARRRRRTSRRWCPRRTRSRRPPSTSQSRGRCWRCAMYPAAVCCCLALSLGCACTLPIAVSPLRRHVHESERHRQTGTSRTSIVRPLTRRCSVRTRRTCSCRTRARGARSRRPSLRRRGAPRMAPPSRRTAAAAPPAAARALPRRGSRTRCGPSLRAGSSSSASGRRRRPPRRRSGELRRPRWARALAVLWKVFGISVGSASSAAPGCSERSGLQRELGSGAAGASQKAGNFTAQGTALLLGQAGRAVCQKRSYCSCLKASISRPAPAIACHHPQQVFHS